MSRQTEKAATETYRTALTAACILFLTAILSLVWSDARSMWSDEFLSFYTDGVASLKDVVLVQLHHPISLDPPMYHLLSHLSMDLMGRGAMALRMPALAGFLLLEVCVSSLCVDWQAGGGAGDGFSLADGKLPVLG